MLLFYLWERLCIETTPISNILLLLVPVPPCPFKPIAAKQTTSPLNKITRKQKKINTWSKYTYIYILTYHQTPRLWVPRWGFNNNGLSQNRTVVFLLCIVKKPEHNKGSYKSSPFWPMCIYMSSSYTLLWFWVVKLEESHKFKTQNCQCNK